MVSPKLKQKAVAAAVTGMSLTLAACSSNVYIPPKKDMNQIYAAIKTGLIQQYSGKSNQDCEVSVPPDPFVNVQPTAHPAPNPSTPFSGIRVNWYESSADNGYICIGQLSNKQNVYSRMSYGSGNNGLPFYPVAYYMTVGNLDQPVEFGFAAVQRNNSMKIQITNMSEGGEKDIATMSIPGWKDPFTYAQRY